jgi:hypothetical protein
MACRILQISNVIYYSFSDINRQVRAKCTNHIVAQELDSLLAQLNAK